MTKIHKTARLTAAFGAALLLGACATGPTSYGPLADGKTGFEETRIENDRYRVAFTAGSTEEAYNFALLRSAELADAQNAPYFEVIRGDRETTGQRSGGGTRLGFGLGGGRGGYYGRRSGASIGIGIPLGGNQQRVRQVLEIKLRQVGGDSDNIYATQDVLRNLTGAT